MLPVEKLQELIEAAIVEHIEPDAWQEYEEQEYADKGLLAEMCARADE